MSDHLSFPRTLAGPASDICDLYAFPSPERPGHLTLVMTVFPRASSAARFSDAVLCRFRLRPASVAATGAQARFLVGGHDSELHFDLVFAEPPTRPGADGSPQAEIDCARWLEGRDLVAVVG